MARLQGGTAGILAALAAGRLDPFSAWLPEEHRLPRFNGADRRRAIRRARIRERIRERAIAQSAPF